VSVVPRYLNFATLSKNLLPVGLVVTDNINSDTRVLEKLNKLCLNLQGNLCYKCIDNDVTHYNFKEYVYMQFCEYCSKDENILHQVRS
jgi:hypothetical protein